MALPQTIFLGAQAAKTAKTVNDIAIEKFSYDFSGLAIRLALFFAVAFLIEIYFKSKIAIDKTIRNPSTTIINSFGLGGILFNYLFNQFKEQADNPEVPTPEASDFFNNESLQKIFSPEGFHGFRFWDIIKIIAGILVLMEWNRFRNATQSSGGKVSPLTHGLFLLFVIGIGLSVVPDLVKKLKVTDFNLENLK